MRTKKVNCGDWGQSWGMSTVTVGKLEINESGNYLWKGHSQGRHGNKWNTGSYLEFILIDEDTVEVVKSKGHFPNKIALLQGIEELNNKI